MYVIRNHRCKFCSFLIQKSFLKNKVIISDDKILTNNVLPFLLVGIACLQTTDVQAQKQLTPVLFGTNRTILTKVNSR